MLVSASAFGQAGFRGGLNMSNLYVDDIDDENVKLAFHVGIYNESEITDFLSIQPELLYTSKGAQLVYDGFLSGSGKYRYNLNYLEVPVLIKLKAGGFAIHGGPYAAILVGANVTNVDDNGTVQDVESLDKDDFNQLDYGLSLGAGFDFEGGELILRYDFGLQEIGKSDFAGEATDQAKNSALMISVGFDF